MQTLGSSLLQAMSLVVEHGLLSSCGVGTPENKPSVTGALGLSCLVTRVILAPQPGICTVRSLLNKRTTSEVPVPRSFFAGK